MTWQEIKVEISDEVKKTLEERHVLEDEVKQVIHYAETEGDKLFQPEANRYLSRLRIGEATFYVDYSVAEGKYRINTAYAHKAQIGG